MKLKLNKKGFTLVEILATVAIMAVLSGVAVTATTKYLEKTRQESYKAMESAAYAAAQNYIQKRNPIIPVFHDKVKDSSISSTYKKRLDTDPTTAGKFYAVTESTEKAALESGALNTAKCPKCFYKLDIDTLVEEEFLDDLKDPKASNANCGGTVFITKEKGSGEKLEAYTYLVEIICHDYESSHKTKNASGKTVSARGVFFHS